MLWGWNLYRILESLLWSSLSSETRDPQVPTSWITTNMRFCLLKLLRLQKVWAVTVLLGFLASHLLQISNWLKKKSNQVYWTHHDAFCFRIMIALQARPSNSLRGGAWLACNLPSFQKYLNRMIGLYKLLHHCKKMSRSIKNLLMENSLWVSGHHYRQYWNFNIISIKLNLIWFYLHRNL